MKRTHLFLIAASVSLGLFSVVACSSDSTSSDGPSNGPPAQTVDSGAPGSDSGAPGDDGGTPVTCTGPTFDNTRIPGWPTVPQP